MAIAIVVCHAYCPIPSTKRSHFIFLSTEIALSHPQSDRTLLFCQLRSPHPKSDRA
ncbi:hypothetical protein [Pseudanabaena sp. PCC 6802]|uniref:hypothetical protein n=1 Tax=Pseudanabaena sp. PCC 6802 TaxID=118173 RepID=UPI0012EAC6A5|nr:hypothetical protein [Pseudanabaena sp. PCC 6802]